MAIAIKQSTQDDELKFAEFLKTERKPLLGLKYHHLPQPHCEIAVIKLNDKINITGINELTKKLQLIYTEHGGFITLSKFAPIQDNNGIDYIFSGYTFLDGKMLIGQGEVFDKHLSAGELSEQYGEFSLLTITDNTITFTSDYFGMEPLYYYDHGGVFAATNNYHLLLLLLKASDASLEMNINRSRVNIITSGFTYGSPFSTDLDVLHCKANLAYENIEYSVENGLKLTHTSAYDVLYNVEKWDEDVYEDCIQRAKDEIHSNVKAVFEHERFKRVVIDVSGGFDSRIVFATANNLSKKLRSKLMTYSRTSGTPDDMEKAAGIINIYNYPKANYIDTDESDVAVVDGEIDLAHVSRTIGTYSCSSHLYTCDCFDLDSIELTGYLGEVVFGYKRCRGEIDYSLGDQKLLARLGGCYLWNSYEPCKQVFADQKEIINQELDQYTSDCLFKKFQVLYVDSRNRYICGSARNIERGSFRIPVIFSKYALKAKWLYFNKFHDNVVPDEKISMDITTAINPLLSMIPFAANNDDVIPPKENLLNPMDIKVTPNFKFDRIPRQTENKNLYRLKVLEYMDDLEIAKQMLLWLYDYNHHYEPVCLGLHKVICEFEEKPDDAKTGHAREQIRKIYDVYYQMMLCAQNESS